MSEPSNSNGGRHRRTHPPSPAAARTNPQKSRFRQALRRSPSTRKPPATPALPRLQRGRSAVAKGPAPWPTKASTHSRGTAIRYPIHPKVRPYRRRADPVQELSFEAGRRRISARPGVAHSRFFLGHAETLAGSIQVPTHDHNCTRSHVLLLANHLLHPGLPVVLESLGRVFSRPDSVLVSQGDMVGGR